MANESNKKSYVLNIDLDSANQLLENHNVSFVEYLDQCIQFFRHEILEDMNECQIQNPSRD